MPELPEVETVVRGLRPLVCGNTITDVSVIRAQPLKGITPEMFCQRLQQRSFESVNRRGKYLIFKLEPELYMLAHLRMTGKFMVDNLNRRLHAHDRVCFILSNRMMLVYADTRCLGTLTLKSKGEVDRDLSQLGIEPLSDQLSLEYLSLICRTSRPIKNVLLDQKKIAGIGNIYASEILFQAGIHPQQQANSLNLAAQKRLMQAISTILNKAIQFQGTSISDFRRVDDSRGGFQEFLAVYQKSQSPCVRCGALIQRIVQQQRSSFFCPLCQQLSDIA